MSYFHLGADAEPSPPKPQFSVIMPEGKAAYGTRLLVNGAEVRNMYSVEVTNDSAVDDIIRSSVVIRLSGEPVLVERG